MAKSHDKSTVDEVTASKPAARFLTDKPRRKAVQLEWPLEYDGREYREITIKRLTAQEVKDLADALRALPEGTPPPRWPIFVDAEGAPIPEEVLDALDPDDDTMLQEAALDFLPRRFVAAARTPESTQPASSTAAP